MGQSVLRCLDPRERGFEAGKDEGPPDGGPSNAWRSTTYLPVALRRLLGCAVITDVLGRPGAAVVVVSGRLGSVTIIVVGWLGAVMIIILGRPGTVAIVGLEEVLFLPPGDLLAERCPLFVCGAEVDAAPDPGVNDFVERVREAVVVPRRRGESWARDVECHRVRQLRDSMAEEYGLREPQPLVALSHERCLTSREACALVSAGELVHSSELVDRREDVLQLGRRVDLLGCHAWPAPSR